MRLRTPMAVLAAALMSVAFAAPALAVSPATTLFVDHNVTCSDTAADSGTTALPFCTIQAAADAALPGQTVMIDPNGHPGPGAEDNYAAGLTITHSGTPGAPITFAAGGTRVDGLPTVFLDGIVDDAPAAETGLTFDGVHDVTFDGIGVDAVAGDAVDITDSSGITLNAGRFVPDVFGDNAFAAVRASGSSSDVTLTRDWLTAEPGGLVLGSGVSDIVFAGNVVRMIQSSTIPAVEVAGTTGTTIVNNTLDVDNTSCPAGIDVSGAATNTVVENNIVEGWAGCTATLTAPLLSVASPATATTTADYNIVATLNGSPHQPYSWGGARYADAADFAAATRQGTHDLNGDPKIPDLQDAATSDIVADSADPNAPDVPAIDFADQPREDDPLAPNTLGGFLDRGAYEQQDPITATVTLSSRHAPIGGTVVATVTANSPWAPATSFTVDFGDGTVLTSATNTISHAYATATNVPVKATATDELGHTSPVSQLVGITVAKPVPTVLTINPQAVGGQAVTLDPRASDSWDVLDFRCDWGDGTPATVIGQFHFCAHTYSKLGEHPITVTMTDGGGNTTTATTTFTATGARFVPFGPKRLLDTRNGTGTGGRIAKLPAGGTLKLQVGGVAGIPAGVQAVALNVTVTSSATGGDVTAYPDGIARPTTSTVNFTAGQTVPNLTIVPVGADGAVDLSVVGGPLDLVADVTGYFVGQSTANGFTSVTSHRLLDTRTSKPIAANAMLPLTIAGAAGIPASGVTAVALNMTVTGPTRDGYITAYPDGTPRPTASTVNFVQGQTVANLAIVPVGTDGKIDIASGSPGSTNVLADVVGYFTATGGNTYVPMTPTRIFDTRQTAAVPARSSVTEQVALPSDNTAGVVMNVTVTAPTKAGFVLVGPDPLPAGLTASTLNWSTAGQTLANLAIPSSPDDNVTVFNDSDGTTNVIGDVSGYFQAGTSQQ